MTTDRLALDLDAFISEHRRCGDLDTGMTHSIVVGSAWEPTAWQAVQRAALGR